ncbi:serine hydrolase domain-containing protein [Paenibacillus sp. FSL R5-0470]|uniref:serine hydrolase domain-containing protein n=1 Tax=Paenibacillus sp. FSL R5-0470 TaxID=2921641 RepID=UPI0030D8F93D
MKKKIISLLMVSLLLVVYLPTNALAADSSKTQTYVNTQKLAAEKAAFLTEKIGTSSLQYALIDGDNIVMSGTAGYSHVESKTAPSTTTMYGIGSTSKMYTTASIMKLVDQGKVDLDAPVVSYLNNFTMEDSRYKQITVRMLLNHSSGLGGSNLSNSFLFNDSDSIAKDNLLATLTTQRLKADPGAYSVYCNDGFTLAELIVEKVSGMDFTTFIHQNFTGPLGLGHTKTPVDSVDSRQLASVYNATYPAALPQETINVIGTGGIYSTAEDLVRFATIFTGGSKEILSEKSVKAMEQEEYKRGMWPKGKDNSFAYGLGWDSVNLYPFNQYEIKALTKGGDTTLYHTSLVVLPDQQMAAAVVSSGGDSTTDQMLANEILLSALQEKGVIKELKPTPTFKASNKEVMPQGLLEYAGVYADSTQLMKIEISKAGELSISSIMAPTFPAQKFSYNTNGEFLDATGTNKVSFVKESNGRVYLWIQGYGVIPGLGETALSQYSAEKLEANALSNEVLSAWQQRQGKLYFDVSEKYSSQFYMSMPVAGIAMFPDAPGYMGSNKITGPNKAEMTVQIPTLGGRDLADIVFENKEGVEYLKVGNQLFITQDAIKPIYAGPQSLVTIQADGYARWYEVPETASGKLMTVGLPPKGSFAVYDANGVCVNFSTVSGLTQVKLPSNGKIVFVSDVGAKFELTIK